MRQISLATMLAALAMASPASTADYGPDAGRCAMDSSDVGIAACTRAIKSGRHQGRRLGRLYVSRAGNYSQRKLYRRAIADYTVAIRLTQSDPPIQRRWNYYYRALVYEKLGDKAAAIRGHRKVLEIYPDTYKSRQALKRLGA